MIEPGANDVEETALRSLKNDFGWLRRLVSLKSILIIAAGLGAAVLIFVGIGGVNISADRPDGWLVTNVLHTVFKRSIGSGAGRVMQPDDFAAPSRIRLAAQHFDMVCANCHGSPGYGQSVTALSMSPRPQYLPKVVGQFSNAELYVVIEHGVKFSAMPSWASDARGDEVWSMVTFLRQLPRMNAAAYQALIAPTAKPVPIDFGPDPTLQPANAQRNAPPKNEFLYAAPATGFSDAAIHDNPAVTCARCHGADGSGAVTGGEAPNLSLQTAPYLQAALQSYVTGARKSGYMQTIAAQLTSAQIKGLAGYYAGLPVQTISAPAANAALVKRGETIATQGIPSSAIPACSNCHESAGSQITNAPHIAGQSATYLRRELTAMGQGGRGSTVIWNPMPAVAHDLGQSDIAALAAYYSGLKPAKSTAGVQPISWTSQAPFGVAAANDVASAKAIFATRCMNCHVNGGRGDLEGNYPNLTIQSKTYVAQNLYAFHAGLRLNDKMQEVAGSLSLKQLTSLADYVNGLTPRPALTRPNPIAALRGSGIATKGIAARGVPACLGCHGANGLAALPLIPTLQGQNVAYLHRKLDGYAGTDPSNNYSLNPMPAIVSKLKDKERADLAAYFAAQPPLPKSVGR